jgi:hypothetical protein
LCATTTISKAGADDNAADAIGGTGPRKENVLLNAGLLRWLSEPSLDCYIDKNAGILYFTFLRHFNCQRGIILGGAHLIATAAVMQAEGKIHHL